MPLSGLQLDFSEDYISVPKSSGMAAESGLKPMEVNAESHDIAEEFKKCRFRVHTRSAEERIYRQCRSLFFRSLCRKDQEIK